MHCFSGSLELARGAMELGFYISFSGNITFKKAEDLRIIAAEIPLDRLLIETDCPYLTPVPFRGKRNEPARVVDVARGLAEVRRMSLEEIGQVTSENFATLFGL
jgi:TatD DNase family protein